MIPVRASPRLEQSLAATLADARSGSDALDARGFCGRVRSEDGVGSVPSSSLGSSIAELMRVAEGFFELDEG
jgi:hypothetical protein